MARSPIPSADENTVSSRLGINPVSTERLLTGFIQNEVRKVGFERVVVGLSGGIDSALSAFLAARALGPENVLAVMMPYKTSSPESLQDARSAVDTLGIKSRVVDITDMADAFIEQCKPSSNKRKGNIMARTRMIVLYDQSEDFGALVRSRARALFLYGLEDAEYASFRVAERTVLARLPAEARARFEVEIWPGSVHQFLEMPRQRETFARAIAWIEALHPCARATPRLPAEA